MRKIIFVLACMLITAMPIVSFADANLDTPVDDEIIEEYSNASTTSANLTISNAGTAKPTAVITGLPGRTTKLAATMYLQKYSGGSWSNVQKWSDSTASNSLSLSKSKSVSHVW